MAVLDVQYVSVWDGGTEIETAARYDTESSLIYEISSVDPIEACGEEVNVLEREYILLPDGRELNVCERGNEYYAFEPLIGSVEISQKHAQSFVELSGLRKADPRFKADAVMESMDISFPDGVSLQITIQNGSVDEGTRPYVNLNWFDEEGEHIDGYTLEGVQAACILDSFEEEFDGQTYIVKIVIEPNGTA